MNRIKTTISILTLALCLGISVSAGAEVPGTMSYHGALSDTDGNQLNAQVEAEFKIFDAEVDGSQKWSEEFDSVDVNDGSFSVQLGAQNPLSGVFDGQAYWLEITIEGETLQPRTPIESVPYALLSADASTLDGKTADELLDEARSAASGGSAGDQSYDNSSSGLNADNTQAALDELLAKITSLEAALDAQESATAGLESQIADHSSALSDLNDATADLDSRVTNQGTTISNNFDRIAQLENGQANNVSQISQNMQQIGANLGNINDLKDLTQDMSRGTINGNQALSFSGVNVHIRNGDNRTNTKNGLGNLIVGYDEARPSSEGATVKDGSHNIVVGRNHNYSSYGGFVAGYQNSVEEIYTSVSGGRKNVANASYAAVSGGIENIASGTNASVSGGSNNTASGTTASILGGFTNEASGNRAVVSAGRDNLATGSYSSVSAGTDNEAAESYSSVSGGRENRAIGSASSISGGSTGTAVGANSSIVGGLKNRTNGAHASVVGGSENKALGNTSSVLGGYNNTSSGVRSTVSGGYNLTASGESSAAAGGRNFDMTYKYGFRAGTQYIYFPVLN